MMLLPPHHLCASDVQQAATHLRQGGHHLAALCVCQDSSLLPQLPRPHPCAQRVTLGATHRRRDLPWHAHLYVRLDITRRLAPLHLQILAWLVQQGATRQRLACHRLAVLCVHPEDTRLHQRPPRQLSARLVQLEVSRRLRGWA